MTGWFFTDKLIHPFLLLLEWRTNRRFWIMFAREGETWKDGRARVIERLEQEAHE